MCGYSPIAIAAALLFACALPALAQTSAQTAETPPLAMQIGTLLSDPKVEGSHWGISVTELDGTPLYALNDAQLFQPASNAKLFTTAAALGLFNPAQTFMTTVSSHGIFTNAAVLKGDIILSGDGDANLSGRQIPYSLNTDEAAPPLRYLEAMAEQIAQSGLKTIDGDVVSIGDRYAHQPYAEGWNLDDLPWGYGAPVSMLSVNDNQLKLVITPGAEQREGANLNVSPDIPYYTVEMGVTTGAEKSATEINVERVPGSKLLFIYGSIPLHGAPDVEHVSIDDPTEFAAIALKKLLQDHGVVVTGKAYANRILTEADTDAQSFRKESREPLPNLKEAAHTQKIIAPPIHADSHDASYEKSTALAQHESPTLLQDVVVTNKVSQNLHAELLLHHLGAVYANGASFAQGARVVRQFAINAGVQPDDFYFVDGSGLSTYDLATPRAITQLLRFAVTQPWGSDYKSSLPVGGVDGTLENRFTKPPLKGNVFAKTGTHSEGNALSGYLVCASGKTVVFSILVGDHLPGTSADREAIDKIVAAIAAAN